MLWMGWLLFCNFRRSYPKCVLFQTNKSLNQGSQYTSLFPPFVLNHLVYFTVQYRYFENDSIAMISSEFTFYRFSFSVIALLSLWYCITARLADWTERITFMILFHLSYPIIVWYHSSQCCQPHGWYLSFSISMSELLKKFYLMPILFQSAIIYILLKYFAI